LLQFVLETKGAPIYDQCVLCGFVPYFRASFHLSVFNNFRVGCVVALSAIPPRDPATRILDTGGNSFLNQAADADEWPTNCVFFQTIISNTVTGIECDTTRIYDNAHSYPKKPGNVIAAFMYHLAWEEASVPYRRS